MALGGWSWLVVTLLGVTDPGGEVSAASLELTKAWEAGRVGKALNLAEQHLADPAAPSALQEQAALTRALALVAQRKWEPAYQALSALADHNVHLGRYGVELRTTAATAAKRCDDSEVLAESLPHTSIFHGPAWARVAACWIAQKNAHAAEAAVDAFEQTADTDARQGTAAILRGRVAELRKSWEDARDEFRRVLVLYPTTPAARTAQERLKLLRKRGVTSNPLAPEELLARADEERAQQRLGSAKRLYTDVKTKVADLVRRAKDDAQRKQLQVLYKQAELGLAEIDIVNRSYTRAMRRVARLVNTPEPDVKARALYLKADIHARRGRLSQSLRIFSRLLKVAPAHPFAQEGALSAANMAYSARYLSKARGFAQWLLDNASERREVAVVGEDGIHRRPHELGSAKDHGHWLMAWNERRSGAVSEVMDSYLGQIDLQGPLGNAALYWRARLAAAKGDWEAAAVFAEMLSSQGPTSFYTLAAADLLPPGARQALVAFPRPGPSHDLPAPSSDAPDMQGLITLVKHGFLREAREVLRNIPSGTLTEAERVAAAWLYVRSGDVFRGTLLAKGAVAEAGPHLRDPVALALAYPRSYADIVEAEASQQGVPPWLIYAVIREESAFRASAVSPRQARGLMQMIKPTALRMAALANLKGFKLSQLFDPNISIKLGATYLGALLQQFDGNIVAAIASYHAGEDRVANWLETRQRLTPDEFIEDIPYPSTRSYVKKVLASYGMYRVLYAGEEGSILGLSLYESMNAAVPAGGPTGRYRLVAAGQLR